MTVKIDLVFDLTPQIKAQVHSALRRIVHTIAPSILYTAIDSMSGPKRGRVYKRGNITHVASAPGEPPARDTGNLASSGYLEEVDDLTMRVGFTASYAAILEGTLLQSPYISGGFYDLTEALGVWAAPSARGVLPRPFLRPAVEAHREAFEAQVKAVLP